MASSANQGNPVSSLRSRSRARKSEPEQAERQTFKDPGTVNSRLVFGHGRYRTSQLSVLLSRYIRMRGDLLIEQGNLREDDPSELHHVATVCSDFLCSARTELESRHANLPVVANLLSMADRTLVSLYRPAILRLRLHSVVSDLEQLDPFPRSQIAQVRFAAQDMGKRQPTDDLADVKTALKDALTYIHGCDERNLIEDDLQVSRLNAVLRYVVGGWIFLMVAISFVSNMQQAANGDLIWPVHSFGRGDTLDLFVGALGLSVVGAVGGIISGMLSVRDSRATLLEYRTSMRKLALKPAAGAVAALAVYLFLTAGVVNGIEITGAGILIVAAFSAGFSERYLLKVLNSQMTEPGPPAIRPASATRKASTSTPGEPDG